MSDLRTENTTTVTCTTPIKIEITHHLSSWDLFFIFFAGSILISLIDHFAK